MRKNETPGGDERRKHVREPVTREVLLSCADDVLLRRGRTLDLSVDGACVVADASMGLGDRVEVEFLAGDGGLAGEAMVARARVVRALAVDGGRTAFGLRFNIGPSVRPGKLPAVGKQRVRSGPRGLQVHPLQEGPPENAIQSRSGNRLHKGILAALLLLLLFLVFTIPEHPPVRSAGVTAPGESSSAAPVAAPFTISGNEEAPMRPVEDLDLALARLPLLELAALAEEGHSAAPGLGRAKKAIPPGGPEGPLGTQRVPPGGKSAAGVALRTPVGSPELFAEGRLSPGVARGTAPVVADQPVILDASRRPGDIVGAPLSEGIWMEVSKRWLKLRVYRGKTLLAAYPVGLGTQDSTPEGTFHIANKVREPAWYQDGRAIPADDPANPLGGYWMGLADRAGLTSFGIHATPESGSIGRNASAGCVRMHPDDADAVFHWCTVDTPVRITG